MWEKLWEINGKRFEETGDELNRAGKLKEARIEYLKSLEITRIHQGNTENLEQKIDEINKVLIEDHKKNAENLETQKEYALASSELEFLLYLLPEGKEKQQVASEIEKLKSLVDRAQADEIAGKNMVSGDKFMQNQDFAEALAEYKEALDFDISPELRDEIIKKLTVLEARFSEIYIKNGDRYLEKDKKSLAVAEYEKALAFLEYNKEIRDKVVSMIKKYGSSNSAVSDKEWDEAYQNFRDTLNRYLGFDYKPSSFWLPSVGNPYQEEYLKAKKQLGLVYLKKANAFEMEKQFNLALKVYHEALSYFNAEDEEGKEISRKIKEIKAKADE